MKTLVLFLLLSIGLTAQNAVGIAVYQDAKLAFFEDDYGNKPFTTDVTIKLKLQAENFVVSGKFEYADLSQDLYRYGAEVGYCFRFDRIGVMPFVGYGRLWSCLLYTSPSPRDS